MKLAELNPNTKKSFLLYGNSGSGKTVAACGFQGPLYIADFDGKVSSAAVFYKGTPQINLIEYEHFNQKNDFNKFWKKLHELKTLAKTPETFPYKTIVLDSITTFAGSLMAEVMRQNPSEKRSKVDDTSVPFLPDYQIAISHFKNTMTSILSLPCTVVATAHIEMNKDETTGEILYQPLVYGKELPSWLPMVFEEVYRTYSELKDGKSIHYAQTRADRKYVCRTQLQNILTPIKLEYSEIAKFF